MDISFCYLHFNSSLIIQPDFFPKRQYKNYLHSAQLLVWGIWTDILSSISGLKINCTSGQQATFNLHYGNIILYAFSKLLSHLVIFASLLNFPTVLTIQLHWAALFITPLLGYTLLPAGLPFCGIANVPASYFGENLLRYYFVR